MTQKIFLSENKRRILIAILALFVSIILIFILVPQKYNYNYFLNKIENDLNIKVIKKGDYSIKFYPSIHLIQKDLELEKKTKNFSLRFREVDVEALKNYWDWNKTDFLINSKSTVINGIPLRDIKIKGNYQKQSLLLNNFSAKVNEGELFFNGLLNLQENNSINIDGKFKNISLTTILNQSRKIYWDKINIKIRSDFYLDSYGNDDSELIKNMHANIPLKGTFYINATPEERFGTALLNVLAEKIPELSGISKSLDFIFTKFTNIPSQIEGLVIIEKGILKTDKLYIINNDSKMEIRISYDLIKDVINGDIFFYDGDKIYLKTKLEGSVSNPKILVGGKPFIQKNNEEPLEDIKKIIEEGITNIFQRILENN